MAANSSRVLFSMLILSSLLSISSAGGGRRMAADKPPEISPVQEPKSTSPSSLETSVGFSFLLSSPSQPSPSFQELQKDVGDEDNALLLLNLLLDEYENFTMSLIYGNELDRRSKFVQPMIIVYDLILALSKQDFKCHINVVLACLEAFIKEVSSFCGKHDIDVPDMGEKFIQARRSRRNARDITNYHHFRVEIFNTMKDWMLNELNDRFNEVNTELLLCVSSLDPSDNFISFDKDKLIRLAEYYSCDFTQLDLQILDDQLDIYIFDVRSNKKFSQLNGISGLTAKLVELKKHDHYQLIFQIYDSSKIRNYGGAQIDEAGEHTNDFIDMLPSFITKMENENKVISLKLDSTVFGSAESTCTYFENSELHDFLNMKMIGANILLACIG
ncbi:hypothetical protein KSP39_PZI003847 [Platanthera zijinensis]|uniref:Uncharacterized protein n=1 Tax=Platanthera zijinensis TaxID=2320716 RepID=A0AAP0BWL5_9ASPA